MAISNPLPAERALETEPQFHSEQTSTADVLGEAVRAGRMDLFFEELRRYRATLPPTPYTEEDIPRLIREVRAETEAERHAGATSTDR